MKIQLETVGTDTNSPFKLLPENKINHLYYWHFHAEYELVYIDRANGTRQVGSHISEYTDGDLVLIGANIPHVNIDYKVTTPYRKTVLHLKPFFKEEFVDKLPELQPINRLLEMAKYGLVFTGETKNEVGALMNELHQLTPFDLFIKVFTILKKLSSSKNFKLLHKTHFKNKFSAKEQKRLGKIYALVNDRFKEKIEVNEVAEVCNLSKPAFCRYFKKQTGSTFITFLNEYRISQAIKYLELGDNVTETCKICGFESLSYFNRTFKKITGENPSKFQTKKKKIKQTKIISKEKP